jgi:hypothetical protein
VRTDHYRGLETVRLVPRRDPALLPAPDAAEIAYLPGGVVLAGAPSLVRRMIDRGLAPDSGGADEPLEALRRRAGGDAALSLAAYIPPSQGPSDALSEWRPLTEHVTAVAASASVDNGLTATALFACDDFDSPRAVADVLERARYTLATPFTGPPLSDALAGLRIERRAADVRVQLALDARTLAALTLAMGAALSPEPQAPPAPSPAPPSSPTPAPAP